MAAAAVAGDAMTTDDVAVLEEFFEVAIHTILYIRGVYPPSKRSPFLFVACSSISPSPISFCLPDIPQSTHVSG
jgi:hypothetical protein